MRGCDREDQPKIIRLRISTELLGIELESDWTSLPRVIVRSRPSVTVQVSAASISAGLEAPPEEIAET